MLAIVGVNGPASTEAGKPRILWSLSKGLYRKGGVGYIQKCALVAFYFS